MSKYKYVNTFVSPEKLDDLKRAMDEEKSPKKYYKYKAWLHYANLKSWQEQNWHHGYVNYAGKEIHCTCGLVAPIDCASELSASVDRSLVGFKLDEVQRSKGHRSLPTFEDLIVAIIVEYKWDEEARIYLWSAICQRCGEFVELLAADQAGFFLSEHNKRCQRRFWGLRSWV